MRFNIGRRALAKSWSLFCLYCTALIVVALTLQSIFEWFIACLVTMIFRPWRTWDYRIFHSSMVPFEFYGSILMTCFVLYLGYRFLCEPIQQQQGLAIDSDILSEPESEDTTMAELMPVSDEVLKDSEATTTASFYSVRSAADDDSVRSIADEDSVRSTADDDSVLSIAYDDSVLSTAYGVSLLSTADDELPPPSIGQKEIRWSSQVLAQLLAVPRNDEDTVFERLRRMSEASGENKARAWIRLMDHRSLSDSTPPTTPDDFRPDTANSSSFLGH